jgi:hypothetical protein
VPLLTAEYLPAFASVPGACGDSGAHARGPVEWWEPLVLVGKEQEGSGRHTGYLFRNICPLGSQADGAGSVLACV